MRCVSKFLMDDMEILFHEESERLIPDGCLVFVVLSTVGVYLDSLVTGFHPLVMCRFLL